MLTSFLVYADAIVIVFSCHWCTCAVALYLVFGCRVVKLLRSVHFSCMVSRRDGLTTSHYAGE